MLCMQQRVIAVMKVLSITLKAFILDCVLCQLETDLFLLSMNYYGYILYATYSFFLRVNARNQPVLNASLLFGAVLFGNIILLIGIIGRWAGVDVAGIAGNSAAKPVVVATVLSIWGINYGLLVRKGRLASLTTLVLIRNSSGVSRVGVRDRRDAG